ncbi:hydrogenase expression/formation protein HypE [Desulfitobacterium chlororespirans]|uniref:Hydrogenase maturation protein, carbamoyl dehydratase HypE n=1 Tax=Desulfitobacterium chlororespirans DSM 11544 TaxID=1121395 RepID=A0A1M7U7W3_9FIRM|nr:hydrogenase expression/formation protein HypE [Desulfitobacterium chlororespirans]SHN78960.1 Hydrogenase maturation protein, carbamoyl dehydratase HypE [Desulfitobacterium chlororespirans DSM 11544]
MERIIMAHGSGGRLSHQLVQEIFQRHLSNDFLNQMNDATCLPGSEKLAITTDSFVVSPIFFRGGDIGKLAVCGTINDLAVAGAQPRYLSLAVILEEGFPIDDLERIVMSIAVTSRQAGVAIVCGDTKVVERGSADKIFINTTGIGSVQERLVGPHCIKPGDYVLISGTLGDHGISILADREGLEFETPVISDCAPLNHLIDSFYMPGVHCMRDPTRGGVGTTLNELARQAQVSILLEEEKLPLNPGVAGACGMLGLDPLYLANEGKVLVIVSPEAAERVLTQMRAHPLGKEAAVIGRVEEADPGLVLLETPLGGKRIVGMLEGEHLPRIC